MSDVQTSAPQVMLSPEELQAITGGLKLPRCQLRVLLQRGFSRARLERGKLVLERAHYDAVCRGEFAAAPAKRDTPRPALRSIK